MRQIPPTACKTEEGRVEYIDLNQDGDSDVVKVYRPVGDEEVLVCRESDMNFDGLPDLFLFFDNHGALIRDEADLDNDGTVNIITIYDQGQVVRQEIDTNSDGVVDRVRFYDNGIPIRIEGDNSGDGRVDYWEYFKAGRLVRIGVDTDGDGRADQWSRDEAATRDDPDAVVEEDTAAKPQEATTKDKEPSKDK